MTVAICAAAYGWPQDFGSAEAAREKDVYALYSLMLSDVKTSHGPDNNVRYLIAATTAVPWSEKPCVNPPADRKAEFDEVLADFAQRHSTPRELKRLISIRKPYELLDAEQARDFMGTRSVARTSTKETRERFQGVTDLLTLSDVYFNRDRNLALTGITTWCGSLCGLSKWRVFEKSASGKWEERNWVNCVSMARLSEPVYFTVNGTDAVTFSHATSSLP
jgi:hypothetical protein